MDWSKLAFQSYRDGNWEIYTADGDGSNQVRRTEHSASDIHPRLSRGCTHIVFASYRAGNYDIYTMNFDGSGLNQLTSDRADDAYPSWSPDGTRIVFQSYRDDQAEIYVMNADGSGQIPLTWDGAYDGEPSWSPDGSKIAFTSNRTGGYRIWVMNADGSGKVRLSSQPYSENPVWSPDGSQIAYDSDGDGDGWQEIWLMNSDGSNQHEVYSPWEPATDAWVRSWSPDGRYVAFTRISFFYYRGNWYWTEAYLDAWDSVDGASIRLGDEDTDWRPDWQTTDAQPPTSNVRVLPTYSRRATKVQWSSSESGGSGLKWYDVQVKSSATGSWTDWRIATTGTFSDFVGAPGHTYYFRSRATDNAYNVESWPTGEGDAHTTFYNWAIHGTVRNNRAIPRAEAVIATTPGAFEISPSDDDGRYLAYVADSASTYTVQWSRSGYGILPPTAFPSASDARADAILPPADNVVADWGFESGGLVSGDWLAGGVVAPMVTDTVKHTGDYAAFLGQSLGFAPPLSVHRPHLQSSGDTRRMAVDRSGIVHMVWTDMISDTFGVYHAWRGNDGTWSSPQNIASSPQYLSWLQLAVDGSGIVHAVWVRDGYNIYYARRESTGSWSSPQNISSSLYSVWWPWLAVDGSGVAHAVWIEERDGNTIYYARRESTGTWSSPQGIFSFYSQYWLYLAPLVVDGDGVVHVGWMDRDIYYIYRRSDGIWSDVESISGNSEEFMQLAVDENGAVHVVWSESQRYNEPDIYYAHREPDGTSSGPENISNSPGRSAWELRGDCVGLAIDGSGVVHVVWEEEFSGIFYSRRETNGVWSTPESLSGTPDESQSHGACMVVERNGTVHVVWSRYYYSDTAAIQYARRRNDGAWSSPRNLHTVSGDISVYDPRIAVEENGLIHVTSLVYVPGPPDAQEIHYIGPAPAGQTGDSTLSQVLAMPATMSNPTLSFLYQLGGVSAVTNAHFSVYVDNGTAVIPLLSTAVNTDVWTHHRSDLTPWSGETITLSLNLHQTEGYPRPWAYLDEVTVGSAYADLWVDKGDLAALPGEQVTYKITYGNRGGVAANEVRITDTLPSELFLVEASPPPVFSTLIWAWEWDVGDMPPESGPFSIVVTATVAPTATMWSSLVNTVSIGSVSPEIETANNVAQATVFVGRRVYLPVVVRGL